jgi:hypothetical protein
VERVELARGSLTIAHDLPALVDSGGTAPCSTQRQFGQSTVVPDESVAFIYRSPALSDDISAIVDTGSSDSRASLSAQRSQVDHDAVLSTRLPKEGMLITRLGVSPTYDLPAVVDGDGSAEKSAQRPQIGHDAFLPKEGVTITVCGIADTHDLPPIVDGAGSARCSA